MKVLIVDDELNIRKLVEYSLNIKGHQVLQAADGSSGIEKALAEKPDVILMDIMMPGISGIEACRQLKKNPETRKIPVIMLTAKSKIADIEAAFAAGANNYITKPFDQARLAEQIEVKMKSKPKV